MKSFKFTSELLDQLKVDGVVDTSEFRYVYCERGFIRRIPLESLDTPYCNIDRWEICNLTDKPLYRIRENWDEWGCLSMDDAIIDRDTLEYLAESWGVPVDDLLDQCDEI